MALLTDNTFHTVTFLVPTDAAWRALSPVPGVPEGIAADVYAGDPIVIFVIDAANGVFAFQGGQGFGYDDTLIDSSVAMTNFTLTSTTAQSTIWGKTGGGSPVYYLEPSTQLVQQVSSVNAAAFKAWLP